MHPWSQSFSEILSKFSSAAETGLSHAQLKLNAERFGKNVLSSQNRISRFSLLFHQFKNPMVYTLSIAGIIAFVLGERLNAIAILSIVILNAFIGFTQESKAEAAIHALKNLSAPKVRVRREGKIHTIDSFEVVPGDILVLEAGDYVVADARIIQAFQLSADESILTGESLPIHKFSDVIEEKAPLAERKNMLFAGTAISSGSGIAVVTSTGMETEIGHIANLLSSTESQMTPLQLRLEKVSTKLLWIGIAVIFVVMGLGLYQGHHWFNIFMTAISLAVAAIPEGLPTVVTLALALAVRRMTKRNALVRKMASVETLGSTDFICTDKTGTLTTGKMAVREVFTLTQGSVSVDRFSGGPLLFKNMILCNNASLDHGGSGDSTEVALLLMAKSFGHDLSSMQATHKRIHEWSFDSQRKRMSVAVKSDKETIVFSKGAPESILPLCLLSSQERNLVEKAVLELSSKGRRLLALGFKTGSEIDFSKKEIDEVEKDFHFLGLVSIADPPKVEAIESIKRCKKAGLKVVMITGDHPVTANAIAHELGIPEDGVFDQVMTGKELDTLSFSEICKRVEVTSVYARVTPEHKLRIIEALQNNGHVVSMTGDGVNDAPALKKADIGVSMGLAGTEVARQASAMILTDDNFSTIVSAIEEGRAIFGNIKRTIQYLLSTNLAEILFMLAASILNLPLPLLPISLLWINLVTDGFPSLALASEPVEKDFLEHSHGPSPKTFFNTSFMRELFFIALIMTVIAFSTYYYMIQTTDVLTARSYAFILMIYLCLFRSFSNRSETKTFFECSFNPWHLASVAVPIILQLSLQNMELYQTLFKVKALSFDEHAFLMLLGLIPVSIIELTKLRKR